MTSSVGTLSGAFGPQPPLELSKKFTEMPPETIAEKNILLLLVNGDIQRAKEIIRYIPSEPGLDPTFVSPAAT